MNETIRELKALFEAAMADKITSFYAGEVAVVPKSNCPALMLYPISSSITARSTAGDTEVNTIGLKVVNTLMEYIDEKGTGDTIKHTEGLVDFMQKRNLDDGRYADDTVMGVLRKKDNVRGTHYIFNDVSEISYDIIRQGEFFYVSASMTLQITTIIARPN